MKRRETHTRSWILGILILGSLTGPGCDISLTGPSLGEIPPGGGGSGTVVAYLLPDVTVLQIGQFVDFTYTTQPEVAVGEVMWVNEHPGVVSIQAPLPGCARCARITGLSIGAAQLRPYSMINGGRIEASWRIAVR
jgi:hypothetical protein